MNPIEIRSAQVADVKFPQRIIDLVVMPYESETVVEHQGRMVREVISRGAFRGINNRANRIHVNRDHDITKVVGRATALHPNDERGLVAECRIADTLLGDETLQLASEDILDASAGFAPMKEQWEDGNTLRRVTQAYLAHIALTPDPAYRDARVLAVRSAAPERRSQPLATPNLDQIRLWRLQAEYDRLSR